MKDGAADLRMSFNLGKLSDFHITPARNTQCADYEVRKQKKRKSPSQQRRDRIRAESFRGRKHKILGSNLVMPFSGKILPVNSLSTKNASKVSEVISSGSSDSSCQAEADSTPPANPKPDVLAPRKVNKQLCYVDVDLAKKELFSYGTSSFSTDPDPDDMQS